MASSSSPNWTHDVYPSFHGVDLRKGFLNQMQKRLRSKGVDLFIDNEIPRGSPIGPELIEAIRGSRIAVVMLSRNYASSSWCLDELVEIMKCKQELGQVVMPVFYELDPADVTKLAGDFGESFRETCAGKTEEDIRRWEKALGQVATIAGYHSRSWDNDATLIEDVAVDILTMLKNTTLSSAFQGLDSDEDVQPKKKKRKGEGASVMLSISKPTRDFDGLVGMEAHMENLEQLLCLDSDQVRMIGICGPSGIGKTTIARNLYQRFAHEFQFSTFVTKINARTRHDDYNPKLQLQKQLLSQLISQMDTGESFHLGVAQEMLRDKKVLVVLDAVDHLEQLEALAEEMPWFGPGSRIIVTTQDIKLLQALGINQIYELGFPTSHQALQIFCKYAFGQNSPYDGFEELAREITTVSGEIPAGLRFMGSYFRGKPKKEWENELPRLRTSVNGELGSIIKFAYDSLCGEDKTLSHHLISSLRDVELTERMEKFLRQGFSEVRQPLTITNQDVKEVFDTNERAFKGISSNGLQHTVCIYCADTLHYSFASHLSVGFHRKGISASVNCNGTLDVIEEASASVVVISKTYLSSPSCLDKLVKVLHCRRKRVQLVVPVFYGISPSDVAVQEQESADRIRDWSSALQELRELPGTHSREESSECELVEEIVRDVYEKLFPMEQIGINSRLLEIRQMLCKQPWGIRRIGIWGMPGIGKTTLAKATFDQIAGGYEASCFIKHFDKAFHEKGLYRLLDEHFGKILKEIPRVCSSITRPSLPGEKICKKRTLVVLDDVQNPLVAESFLGGFHWFCPGSLIIITSRDKQVFRLCQINHVYEVQSLSKNEAMQLFSQCAFGEDIREQNLLGLSMEVIDYANGNPFALSFYGGELKGKKLSEMETTFLNFKLRTPYKIRELFKSSYETLDDNEKDIFLDIACFFKGEDVDYVMQVLEGCGLFPHVGIDVLVEKCLVTISENRVEMHRIIQDFGRDIINRETIWIERGRRLWDPCTIKLILEDDKLEASEHPYTTSKRALGTEDIKGISLDTSDLLFDMKPTALKNMLNLRFLKIYCSNHDEQYGLRLPRGLESLPSELRILHWECYPFESLPQEFDPGHLVELNMSYSHLQKLWGGTKNLDMLKMVRLCHSQQLTGIGDICKAQNIELIDLKGCIKLQSFPATGHLQHLRVVNLSGCREIKTFPEFSPNSEELHLQGNATNLKKLYLSGCSSLVQLSSSIGSASHLEVLDLSNCSSLMELPSSIGNAINLRELNLEHCSSLVELPSSIGNATNLKKLCLSGCSGLVQLPSSIANATNLQELNLEYCSSLVELPSSLGNATNLMKLYLTGCSSLVQLPSSIRNLSSLMFIDLEEDNSLPIVTFSDNSGSRCIEVRRAKTGKFFVLKGEQKDEHSVSLILRVVDKYEHARNNQFLFNLEDDTAYRVSSGVVEQLELTDIHLTFVAELIDILLVNMIPTWKTDVTVDHLIDLQLNQKSRSHWNEGKTQRREESGFHDDYASVSHSDWPPSDEEGKQCADAIKVEDESSNQEAEEPVSLEEEERLRRELEEIEAEYREEMKEIARKREEAIMETKKKLSLMKRE